MFASLKVNDRVILVKDGSRAKILEVGPADRGRPPRYLVEVCEADRPETGAQGEFRFWCGPDDVMPGSGFAAPGVGVIHPKGSVIRYAPDGTISEIIHPDDPRAKEEI